MRPLYLACTIVILFSSCLGPRKVNKWVDQKYGGNIQESKKKSDYITVSTSLGSADSKISATESKTSNFLPLLFYWQWDYKNMCTLNAKIPISNFTTTALSYANSKGLRQKLKGRRVELSVDNVPTAFVIDDKGHMIWVVLYVFGWEYLSVQPSATDMVVSYKLLENDAEVKKGVITIPDTDKGVNIKMFQSTRKKTWQYLDQYDANITTMSKKVIDKLITEL